MSTIPAQSAQVQQEEAQPEAQLQRTHARYAYDALWQADLARCERGKPPVLGTCCRCGGTPFGKPRGEGFAFFPGLPTSHPHSCQHPVQTSAPAALLVKPIAHQLAERRRSLI